MTNDANMGKKLPTNLRLIQIKHSWIILVKLKVALLVISVEKNELRMNLEKIIHDDEGGKLTSGKTFNKMTKDRKEPFLKYVNSKG